MEITWKNTLYPHSYIGTIDKMMDLAIKLEYEFFAWNGRIYKSKTGKQTAYIETDID